MCQGRGEGCIERFRFVANCGQLRTTPANCGQLQTIVDKFVYWFSLAYVCRKFEENMVQVKGGVRNVSRTSKAYQNRLREVEKMRASGKYSSVEMPRNGTGWVAIEKSRMKHTSDEIEAAFYMAKAGYKVTLKSEEGHAVTPDGFLFSFAYEQKTPHIKTEKGIIKALGHAKSKERSGLRIDIAVIYDKFDNYSGKDVEDGIRAFEKLNKKRFRGIIFITKTGRVFVHRHNEA